MMMGLRLAVVAAAAYAVGARDWPGAVGALATLAAVELAALYRRGSMRAQARRWKAKHPA